MSHLTAFEVVDHAPAFGADPDHKVNLKYLLIMAEGARTKARKAKKNGLYYAAELDALQNSFNQYKEFFNVKNMPAFPAFNPGEREAFQAKNEAWEAMAGKRQEALKAARMAAALDKFNAWKAGGVVYGVHFYDFPVALRIKEGRVETSRGAQVTVKEAIKALAAWKAGTLSQGQDIGHYTVSGVSPEAVTIGCHVIPVAAIVELDNQLNKAV